MQLVASLTSALDLTTVEAPMSIGRQINFADGAGAGQANLIWTDTRTVGPSATDSIDLAGSLTSALGGPITFARIKGLIVATPLVNVTNVSISRGATNGVPLFSAVSTSIAVKPGGVFLWMDPSAAGVVVTPATGDLIDMVNSGASPATYDIAIIGAAS
jgi:hypothetical protein